MTVMSILAFANVIYILNIDRGPEHRYIDEDGAMQNLILFPKSLDQGYWNSIIYSYKMSLGDFATSSYGGNN